MSGRSDVARRFNTLISSYSAADGLAGVINVCGIVIVLRVLSIEEFGLVDFLRVAQWFVGTLTGLGVLGGAMRFYFETRDEDERRRVLGTALVSRLVSGGLGALVLVLVHPVAAPAGITVERAGLWLAAATIPASGVVEVVLQTAVNRGKPGIYALVVITQASLNLIGVAVLVVLARSGVSGYLATLLVAAALTSIIGYAVQRREYRWTWRLTRYRDYVALGAPFVVTTLMQYGFGLFIRWLLVLGGSTSALGWYAFAERVPTAVRLIITAAGKTWLPWILAERPLAREHVAEPVRHMNGLVLVALGTVLVFLDELMWLVGGARYGPAHWAARLLLVANWVYFVGDWVVSASLLVAKRPIYRIWIFAMAYGIAGALSLWAIPMWGAVAAAGAVLLATTIVMVGMIVVSNAVYPLDYGLGKLLPASCLVIALAIWGSAVPSPWLRVAILAGCFLSMWYFRLLPAAAFRASGRSA